jgi:hypothetical protein
MTSGCFWRNLTTRKFKGVSQDTPNHGESHLKPKTFTFYVDSSQNAPFLEESAELL